MLPYSSVTYQTIDLPEANQQGVQITFKRLDQNHPEISGNKWYKLKYNIKEAVRQKHDQLLTFGGAYSNHIQATAAAAKSAGLKAIGVIRGEETLPLNPTLEYSLHAGMHLHYLSRSEYRTKDSVGVLSQLQQIYGDFYSIPEGGTNALAIEGTKEILESRDSQYDIVCTSIGTGGTIAGILATALSSQKVMGFSSLKGDFIHRKIHHLLEQHAIQPVSSYEIIDRYHFNGYAKYNKHLLNFMHAFTEKSGIPLDPIYTGKMVFGLVDLLQKGSFPAGSNILVLHTGGLQGVKGFNQRHGTYLPEK